MDVDLKISIGEEKTTGIDFGKEQAVFPQLRLVGRELPITEDQVGHNIPIRGVLRLRSIKAQGYSYNFDLVRIEFPDSGVEIGTIAERKKHKEKKAGK